jgi:hypothetical protein
MMKREWAGSAAVAVRTPRAWTVTVMSSAGRTSKHKKKGLRTDPEPSIDRRRESLVQVRRDVGEGRREVGRNALHGGDDRNGDAGSDQAVLDGGRSGFVVHETLDESFDQS